VNRQGGVVTWGVERSGQRRKADERREEERGR